MTDEINPDEGLSASTRFIFHTRFPTRLLFHHQGREIRLEQLHREFADIHYEFTNNSASPDIDETRAMERRISMILAELAELRDGLGRVQEKDDQFVEEIKQLENLVDYLSLKEAVELLSELCEACISEGAYKLRLLQSCFLAGVYFIQL